MLIPIVAGAYFLGSTAVGAGFDLHHNIKKAGGIKKWWKGPPAKKTHRKAHKKSRRH